jgi:CRP-like cAMP-binding protein
MDQDYRQSSLRDRGSAFLYEGDVLAPLVRRWAKRTKLSPEDRSAILALPITPQVFAKDSYLVREGEEARECALILRGFAYRQKSLRDGSRQIISFHIPTEFVDLQNALLGKADHNVQSLNRAEVALIPRAALKELADNYPRVRDAMWIDTLVDSSVFREWVVNVGRRDSRTRIAHLLCELACRFKSLGVGNDDRYEFPITQEQLADATGLTSVHTNRTLQSLRKDNLIQLSAGSLTILNWDGLREAGEFDEFYLHQRM